MNVPTTLDVAMEFVKVILPNKIQTSIIRIVKM